MSECTHDCSSCGADCASRNKPESLLEAQNAFSNVKKVIAVVSGKGGVGKSLVTGLLSVLTKRNGHSTAILDADITGPSIPKMFGVHDKAMGTEDGILPVESRTGVKMMSVNLLLENDTDPVIWRGALIAGTVKQFWTDVLWGDVDIIIVTSPQELVGMIVEKAAKMAKMMNIPVLGLVENMSWISCPDCGKKIFPFGESQPAKVALEEGIPLLAQLPIDPALARECDTGVIELFNEDWMDPVISAVENCPKRVINS